MRALSTTILLVTLISTLGVLSDYLLRRKEKDSIRNWLDGKLKKLYLANYPDLPKIVSNKTIFYFNHTFGPKVWKLNSIILIAVFSGYLTGFAIRVSSIIIYLPNYYLFDFIWVGVGSSAILTVLSLGFKETTKIINIKFVIAAILFTVLWMIIASNYPSLLGGGLFQEYNIEAIINSIRNGAINLFYDFISVAFTLYVLHMIRNVSFIKQVILILIDSIICFLLAGFSMYTLMIFDQISINIFIVYDLIFSFLTGFRYSQDSLTYLLFGCTTLIPTCFYLFILFSAALMKPLLNVSNLIGKYILQSRLEDEELRIFTVIGLFLSVVVLIIRLVTGV